MTDLDKLKAAFDAMGVEYVENLTYKPLNYLEKNSERNITGFSVDLEPHSDAEFSFLFDTEGKYTEMELFTSW